MSTTNKTVKFGKMFSNIDTSKVRDEGVAKTLEAGAYVATVKALYFTKGKDTDSRNFHAEIHIEDEDKTLYSGSVNFVKKDGKEPNSIGMSKLKSYLRAVDTEWNDNNKDFISESEIMEDTRLTKDNKPYTVHTFANAIDQKVAVLVHKVKEGENGATYNAINMVCNLDDSEAIEAFKVRVSETPVRIIKPKEDSSASGGMKTSSDGAKASSAASKL